MARRKKAVKLRGKRTHGYGSSKKHRGKGSRGGKGMAGSLGQRATYMLKYDTEHIGKKGFTSKTGKRLRAINLRTLEKMAGSVKKIDVKALGYDKVLGTGEITKPIEVHSDYFSASAKEKIEKAGGKAVGSVSGHDEEAVKEESGAPEEKE
jgi:large subunit ribosomal protein L15